MGSRTRATHQRLLDRIDRYERQLTELRREFLADGELSGPERQRLDGLRERIDELRSRAGAEASAGGGVDIDRDVERARELQRRLDATQDDEERRRIATALVLLHGRVETQVRGAPVDAGGLPVLSGRVRWTPNSPVAGTIEDIDPFGNIDLWRSLARGGAPAREVQDRTLERRFPVTSEVSSLETPVILWVRGAVESERAAALVGSSDLREAHRGLHLAPGQRRTALVRARLVAAEHRRAYARVEFTITLEDAPPAPDLDDVRPSDDAARGTGRDEALRTRAPHDEDDLGNALVTALDGVGQGAGFLGSLTGAALLEFGSLGGGVLTVLASYYRFLQDQESQARATGESLAGEIALRAAIRLAASLRDGTYEFGQVTFNQLNRFADRSGGMQRRIGQWIGSSREIPDTAEFFDRMTRESLRRMATILTEQLGRIPDQYRRALQERASSQGASGEALRNAVEAAYRRGIAGVRGRFLIEFARSAGSRLSGS